MWEVKEAVTPFASALKSPLVWGEVLCGYILITITYDALILAPVKIHPSFTLIYLFSILILGSCCLAKIS